MTPMTCPYQKFKKKKKHTHKPCSLYGVKMYFIRTKLKSMKGSKITNEPTNPIYDDVTTTTTTQTTTKPTT